VALIDRCLTALGSAHGAIPAIAVTDTLKRAEAGRITETVSRDGLWRAQTPQAFNFMALLAAHRAAPPGLTDDAAVAELAGMQLALVAGDPDNIKMTHEADFAARIAVPRTGQGFDVHRFDAAGTAETIMLGGMPVPHNRRIIGHSDADLVLHAITDALYGAIADGDIGAHFPPSDAANKDRASVDFLRHAADRVAAAGCRIVHIDVTVICEAPKIGPHRAAMTQTIAGLLHLDTQAVSVKATTTEGLGFTGRGEGLAAQALATIVPSQMS
jgi:2-C-methyl-D-erythritol 4-phosphate cytidylyltransferase/2-C-methyl-D-erythritol 2,4-cyclodiphosphate synthase